MTEDRPGAEGAENPLGNLTYSQIQELSPQQLEKHRLVALALLAFDSKTPAAARVAALKELAPTDKTKDEYLNASKDPSTLALSDIDAELNALGAD